MIDTRLFKQKLLDLAIRGKLVPQNPAEEPAAELLKRIQAEKAKLIKDGKLKKSKPLPAISPEEIPFEIPPSWQWVRLGTLCNYGECINAEPCEIPNNSWILDLEDIEKDTGKLLRRVLKQDRKTTSSKHRFHKNNVLYSKLRTYLNKVLVADQDGFCTSEILPLDFDKYVVPEFARKVLMSAMFLNYTAQCGYGVKMPRLGTEDGRKALFPLPPLAEQQRIVAKLEELLKHTENIDTAAADLERFLGLAKQKSLDLAIRGKLVPQDPAEEPAAELLKRIQAEKAKLIKDGKLKKSKPLPAISPEEIPFEIPTSWQWVRLDSIFNFIDYRGKTPNKISSGIPLITAKNVKTGFISHNPAEYISIDEYEERKSRGISKRGDILFTTEAPLGNAALADNDIYSAGQRIITFQQYGENIFCNQLFMFFILSPYFQELLNSKHTGTTVAGIKAERLKKLLIPLPPLAEQQRIVAKLEKLFAETQKLLETQKP